MTEQAFKKAQEIKRQQKRWVERMVAISIDGRPMDEKQAAMAEIKANIDRLQKEFESL